jgi:hypothetical protein
LFSSRSTGLSDVGLVGASERLVIAVCLYRFISDTVSQIRLTELLRYFALLLTCLLDTLAIPTCVVVVWCLIVVESSRDFYRTPN